LEACNLALGGGRRRGQPNSSKATPVLGRRSSGRGPRGHTDAIAGRKQGGEGTCERARWRPVATAAGAAAPANGRRGRGNKRHKEVLCRRTEPLGGSGGVGVARLVKLGKQPLMAADGNGELWRRGCAREKTGRLYSQGSGRELAAFAMTEMRHGGGGRVRRMGICPAWHDMDRGSGASVVAWRLWVQSRGARSASRSSHWNAWPPRDLGVQAPGAAAREMRRWSAWRAACESAKARQARQGAVLTRCGSV
jgi:hypothetical protein